MKSHFSKTQESVIDFFIADSELLATWVEDVLRPSIDILNIKTALNSLIDDIEQFEKSRGQTESTIKSKKKVKAILEIAERLDKVATQNNTLQVIAKQSHVKLSNALAENEILKKQIEANTLAYHAT